MNRFAELLDRLTYEPSRNAKLRLMTDYFRSTRHLCGTAAEFCHISARSRSRPYRKSPRESVDPRPTGSLCGLIWCAVVRLFLSLRGAANSNLGLRQEGDVPRRRSLKRVSWGRGAQYARALSPNSSDVLFN